MYNVYIAAANGCKNTWFWYHITEQLINGIGRIEG